MKIAVYAAAKNEAPHVARFMRSAMGADHIVVTDTGSTDGTPELLQEGGATVRHASIVPWRFDVGFNQALCNVPADVDICIKLDLDEVLHTNDGQHWRKEIEQLWTLGTQQMSYWYIWSWLNGKPGVRFRTGLIHHRRNFLWRHPGHTLLTHAGASKPTKVELHNVEIHHFPTDKARPSYIPLLQLGVQECPCARTIYYLAREYFLQGMYIQAVAQLMRYLDQPDARWPAERAEAQRMIAVSCRKMSDHRKAFAWLARAIAEYPDSRVLWFEMLRHFWELSDFVGGYWAGLQCLSYTHRNPDYVTASAEAWSELPFAYTADCALHMDRIEEGGSLLQRAFARAQDSELVKDIATRHKLLN